MECSIKERTLATLASRTDLCTLFLCCRSDDHTSCSPMAVERIQTVYGAWRETFLHLAVRKVPVIDWADKVLRRYQLVQLCNTSAAVLRHNSLRQQRCHALRNSSPPALRPGESPLREAARASPSLALELVVRRCRGAAVAPLGALIAAFPPLSVRMRILETCGGRADAEPADARDRLLGVERVGPGSTRADEASRARAQTLLTLTSEELAAFAEQPASECRARQLVRWADNVSRGGLTAFPDASSWSAGCNYVAELDAQRLRQRQLAAALPLLVREAVRSAASRSHPAVESSVGTPGAAGAWREYERNRREAARAARNSSDARRSRTDFLGAVPPDERATAQRHFGVAWAQSEPDFVFTNRELMPRRESFAAPLDNVALLAEQRLQRATGRHPSSHERCKAASGSCCRRALRPKLEPSGFFSTLHGLVKPLLFAARTDRLLATPLLPDYTSPSTCERRDLSCFFEPLAECAPREGGSRKPLDVRESNFIRRESPAHRPLVVPTHLSWFAWVSRALALLMTPSRALQRDLDHAAVHTGLEAALAAGRVVGLHVRHGDACSPHEEARMARTCSPLSAYMPHVRRLAAALRTNVVYLSTDSALVVREAAEQHSDLRFLHLPNVSRSASYLKRPPDLWDARIRRWSRRGKQELAFREAWLASLDALLLARSDAMVGKFSSNFFRVAFSLSSSACRCVRPFVSLDAPWCFDYGMLSGANWAFPSLAPDAPDPGTRAKSGAAEARNEPAFVLPDRFEC